MAFFNDDTAIVVQMISAPLEIVGFTMAYVELFEYRIAQDINKLIFHKNWKWRKLQLPEPTYESQFGKWLNGQTKLLFVIPLIIIILSALLYHFFWQPMPIYFFIKLPIYAGLIFFLFKYLLITIIKITRDKSIGLLGIILAFIGVLGEVYQVLVIFFG